MLLPEEILPCAATAGVRVRAPSLCLRHSLPRGLAFRPGGGLPAQLALRSATALACKCGTTGERFWGAAAHPVGPMCAVGCAPRAGEVEQRRHVRAAAKPGPRMSGRRSGKE